MREERRAERRRMSSRSSGGRVCLGGALRFGRALVVVVEDSGSRSTELRALRMSCALAARRRAVLSPCSYAFSGTWVAQKGDSTSETASRSFCADCFFVEPHSVRTLFASAAYRAANFGLPCSTDSSIGGSILSINLVVDEADVDC